MMKVHPTLLVLAVVALILLFNHFGRDGIRNLMSKHQDPVSSKRLLDSMTAQQKKNQAYLSELSKIENPQLIEIISAYKSDKTKFSAQYVGKQVDARGKIKSILVATPPFKSTGSVRVELRIRYALIDCLGVDAQVASVLNEGEMVEIVGRIYGMEDGLMWHPLYVSEADTGKRLLLKNCVFKK